MGVVVDPCVAERNECAEHAAPRAFVDVGADAEHAQFVVLPTKQ
jgi:hypothetical protein